MKTSGLSAECLGAVGVEYIFGIAGEENVDFLESLRKSPGFGEYGLEFNNPDFVKHAGSCGATGHRIGSTDESIPNLEKCFDAGGVHLIDCPVDYSENDRILNDEIEERSAKV